MMVEHRNPDGLIHLLIDDKGRVIAHHADFQRSGYGGFTLVESQRVRCRDGLARATVEAYASPALTRVVDTYDAKSMVGKLVNSHGYRVHEIVIGHGKDQPNAE